MKNFEDAIKSAKKKKPFNKFYIELTSGERLEVPHPETLITDTHGTWVLATSKNGVSIFDAECIAQIHFPPAGSKGRKSPVK
ncbi:MAG: hypothetical protein NUW37_15660 [Planctomycetes bacterium]|nr:hypothetical protein [Planctomycetota bacterium]